MLSASAFLSPLLLSASLSLHVLAPQDEHRKDREGLTGSGEMQPSLLLSLGSDMLTQRWDLNTGRMHG